MGHVKLLFLSTTYLLGGVKRGGTRDGVAALKNSRRNSTT